ncbi:MAG: DUF3450 family protein [Planctomycetota bacterium]
MRRWIPSRRTRSVSVLTLLTILTAMGVAPPLGAADSDARDTLRRTDAAEGERAQELARLQERLRRRSEEALARRKEQRERLQTLEAEARASRRRNDTILREIEKREERIAELGRTREEAVVRSEDLVARESAVKEQLERFLQELRGRIEAGIPWKTADRAASVTDAIEAMADPRTNGASSLASVGRLQKEQEAFGRLVESSTLGVEAGGGHRAVPAFHIGLLGVIFAGEEGPVIGFAGRGDSLEDGLTSLSSRPEAAKGYLQTIDILNRRRTPQLTDLYFPRLPIEGGER